MIEPIVWETYGNVLIRELGNEDIDKLVQFVINCQLDELFVLHPREKRESYEIYKNFYKFALGQRQSLIAIDTESDEVVGIIICLIMTSEMKSWINLRFIADESIKTIFNLFYLMICQSQGLEPSHQPIDSLLVLHIAVPRYRKGHNWKPRLLNAVSKMAACLKMPCIIHFAFSKNDQIRSERAGMKEQARIYYLQYIDPETRKRPFRLIRQDELCVILYKKEIKKIIPYYEIKNGNCTYPKKKKSSRRYYIPSVPSYISIISENLSTIRLLKNRSSSSHKTIKFKKEKIMRLKKSVGTTSFCIVY